MEQAKAQFVFIFFLLLVVVLLLNFYNTDSSHQIQRVVKHDTLSLQPDQIKSKIIYFLHIHNAGGTSIKRLLLLNLWLDLWNISFNRVNIVHVRAGTIEQLHDKSEFEL